MMVTYTASSQDLDSVKCVATEIAIEDFLNCRLCDESNVFIIDYSTKINSRRQLEICIMRNHVHLLIAADNLDDISSFVRHYTSLFVTEFNRDIGRTGPLFHKSFGSAPKRGSKSIRYEYDEAGNPVLTSERSLTFPVYVKPGEDNRYGIRFMNGIYYVDASSVKELSNCVHVLSYCSSERLVKYS